MLQVRLSPSLVRTVPLSQVELVEEVGESSTAGAVGMHTSSWLDAPSTSCQALIPYDPLGTATATSHCTITLLGGPEAPPLPPPLAYQRQQQQEQQQQSEEDLPRGEDEPAMPDILPAFQTVRLGSLEPEWQQETSPGW